MICSLNGYGAQSPLKNDVGHDLNYLAMNGVLAGTGTVDETVAPWPPLADCAASLFGLSTILGALLERTTGRSFAMLVEERIARPLGLAIGLFDPERPPVRHVLGLAAPGRPEDIGNLGSYGAAGALYGSPLALYAFDRALLDHRLLGEAATAEMWKGDPGLGAAALGQWQYEAPLAGCPAPVSVVERRGQIGGVQIRNFILPETKRALVLSTRRGDFDFGEVWQAKGFAYEMLSTIGCRA